ncbi:hypothetical protein [Nitrospira sp. BLG_1]|uniref:hypothetical protein n=1 Tax=Nitrospira sp. BLG_1 TaxID=3395883 RepID=UPI0039BC5C1B
MSGLAYFDSRPLVKQGTSAAGASVAVTLAAEPNKSWRLRAINIKYSSMPGGAGAIVVNTVVAFTQLGSAVSLSCSRYYAVAAEMYTIDFQGHEIMGDPNTAIVVTLDAGSGAVVATLDVFYE